MKNFVFILFVVISHTTFANSVTGRAVVNISELEATVRVEDLVAQTLFQNLDTNPSYHGSTAIKETSEVACFQYNDSIVPTYTCVIFVFVNKNFISKKSRYMTSERLNARD